MNKQTLLKLLYSLTLIIFLTACGSGSEDDGISGTGFDVAGAAQKGPFLLGSTVTVNRLTTIGEPSSDTILTETKNDLGNFEFSTNQPHLLSISVNGYHFNEISGKNSDSTLTLRAIYNMSSKVAQTAHVNVLTHLIHNRVLSLIKSSVSPKEAIDTAQQEWVTAFQKVLIVENVADFTDLTVYDLTDQFSDSNAYLLAISSVVYQYATSKGTLKENPIDAELTAVLNYLASDFAEDGIISDEVLLGDLATASRLVRPNNIEENLAARSYQTLSQRLSVAQINRFIDSDGDGKVNINDDDDDNDGILDIEDATPYGTTPEQVNGNYRPLAASFKAETDEDIPLNIDFLVHDLDDDQLQLFIEKYPMKGVLQGELPNIIYTPLSNYNGRDKFTYKVSDGVNDSIVATVEVTIRPVNDIPTIAGKPNLATNAFEEYIFIPNASDIEFDSLDFAVDNLPVWATFDRENGKISGIPNNDDAGIYEDIRLSVLDSKNAGPVYLPSFDLTVKKNPFKEIQSLPFKMYGLSSVAYDSKIYVFGGSGSDFGTRQGVYSYDPSKPSIAWSTLAKIPLPLEDSTAHVVDDKIYVVAGLGFNVPYLSLWEYNPRSNIWVDKTPRPFCGNDFTSSALNGKIYVFGGRCKRSLSRVQIYDVKTDSWSLGQDAPQASYDGASCVLGEKIYLIGGWINHSNAAVHIYDPSSDTWSSANNMIYPRAQHSCVVVDEKLIVFGGRTAVGTNREAPWVEMLNPISGDWSHIATMRTVRSFHSSVVINSKAYILGGIDHSTPGVFDTASAQEFDPMIIE